jgi:hypothetical protein
MTDDQRFNEARERVVGITRERHGIGMQGEKTLHAVLKYYYAPDEDMHEIPIDSFVADIYTGREIIEIQTAGLGQMKNKLAYFLPLYPVTVVHPVIHQKWLSWLDPSTGECSPPRKTARIGTIYQIFEELMSIRTFLCHENLRFRFPLVDVEEYRLLDGWSRDKKRGSHRYDRVPLAIHEEVAIDCPEDYLQFVPYELPEPFTVAELGKLVRLDKREAGMLVYTLHHLDIVKRVGKRGRAFEYIVNT